MNKSTKQQIFTIPNMLSFFRLLLIPIFIWQYCIEKNYIITAVLLIVSGVTDVADGFIARHFNMISDLGKALDPVADKLTQFAMLGCLITRFRQMFIPFALIFVKELITGIWGIIVIKKTGEVKGADWHGKVTTILLYLMIVIHVIWYDISNTASFILVALCVCMMLFSFILYSIRHIHTLKKHQNRLWLSGKEAQW